MYRQTGIIPEITGDKTPKRLVIFDTEAFRGGFTKGLELQTLRLGVAKFILLDKKLQVKEDQYSNFKCVSDLYQFIEFHTRKDQVLYCYAHNLKYDLQLSGLFTAMLEAGWDVGLFVISDPPTFIRMKRGRMSVLFVDTFNYWQFSLSKMGEQLALAKLPMPEAKAADAEWFIYCKRDVDVLASYLLEFIRYLKDNDLAPLGLTLASQAFRSFRHRFMIHAIELHNDKNATALERDSYCGGRVEAFKIGLCPQQDYFKVDVNSMYPFVMKEGIFPYRLAGYTENLSLQQVSKLAPDYYLIADVKLRSEHAFFPIKYNHKLIFPVGECQAVLHHSELIYAMTKAEVLRVDRLAMYEQADLFSSYVDFFYQLKLKAEADHNPLLRSQAKIFLNSLYGKFGQRDIITKYMDNPDTPEYKRLTGYSESIGQNVEVNYLGNMIQLSYHGGESAYSFPAIAGAVTAYARMYLYKLISQAGLENVFYLDTDSLIVNQQGYDHLASYMNDTKLGCMKLEGVSRYLMIRGAKDYTFGPEVKHKGLPKAAVEIGVNQWQYEQFRGAKTWINQGLPVGVEVYQRVKSRKTPYNKGSVDSEGNVTPLAF